MNIYDKYTINIFNLSHEIHSHSSLLLIITVNISRGLVSQRFNSMLLSFILCLYVRPSLLSKETECGSEISCIPDVQKAASERVSTEM